MNTLSVIIPCYNEAEILQQTYSTLSIELKKIGRPYEVIFVDDGSVDDTFNIISTIRAQDEHIGGIQLSRNFGKEGVLLAGLVASRGDLVVVMDADLQDPPSLLSEMIHLIENEGYDQVGTYRLSRKTQGFLTRIFSESYYRTYNANSYHRVHHNEREFRMMSRLVVDVLIRFQEKNRYLKSLWSWVGFKTYFIGYEDIDRIGGKTKYNIQSKLKVAFHNIFAASSRPLSIIKNVTFIYAVLLIGLTLSSEMLKLDVTHLVVGWLFLVQFIFLSLLSVYVGNTYLESKQRPNYVIRQSHESRVF